LRAHEWFVLQASNSGVAGQPFLIEELASETDALRRLDLLWAIGAPGNDAAREALIEFLERDDVEPLEKLFAAQQLVRMGPAGEIAPRLKQLALRIEDPVARRALQCLLWKWY
jgi:HEAT repeat protein